MAIYELIFILIKKDNLNAGLSKIELGYRVNNLFFYLVPIVFLSEKFN
tara:strand:- start:1397 stop:1540 length:144 start_codon:yes stop_codon:yes gene_type:complete